MARMRREFSREFKLEVCRQLAGGLKRPAQICREHQLADNVLLRWRREYEGRGEAAFSPQTLAPTAEQDQHIAELERFCGQLALENAVLKKALQTHLSRSDTP